MIPYEYMMWLINQSINLSAIYIMFLIKTKRFQKITNFHSNTLHCQQAITVKSYTYYENGIKKKYVFITIILTSINMNMLNNLNCLTCESKPWCTFIIVSF